MDMEREVETFPSDTEASTQDDLNDSHPLNHEEYDDDDLFYEGTMRIKEAETTMESESNGTASSLDHFIQELNAYEKSYYKNRVDSTSSVINFWNQKSTTFPILHGVAMIVLAAAGTQVSVERLFSYPKFIWADLRANLSSENLKNVLIIRNNFAHIDDKFFQK